VALHFLADTNFDQRIVAGLLRREPAINFELPHGIIPPQMSDPDVLALAAQLDRVLVTHDLRTMPKFFGEFVAHTSSPGMIVVPQPMALGDAIEELLQIWRLAKAEDWRNFYRVL
jgi:hypothetical protein